MRTFLNNEINIPKGTVLDLRFGVQERDEGRRQLSSQCTDCVTVGRSHELHVRQDDLHGGHDNSRVRMLQTRSDTFNNAFRLTSVGGSVLGQRVQDEDLAPFGTFVQGGQQLLEDGSTDLHNILPGVFCDF